MIPAHDERTTIRRLLTGLLAGAAPGEFEIVVACNGCTDDTAAVVRDGFPGVVVVETPVASKPAALDLGDSAAIAWPRFYVDADVAIEAADLRAVVAAMKTTGVDAAAPRLDLDLTGRPWAVRAYYRVWREGPYLDAGHIGSGVYVLSAAGRSRFGAWPRIISDDLYVRDLFTSAERLTVPTASFVQHPPRSLREVIRIKARMEAGHLQYRDAFPQQAGRSDVVHPGRSIREIVRHPTSWPSTAVYLGVTVLSRRKARAKAARGEFHVWERAESSRAEPGR